MAPAAEADRPTSADKRLDLNFWRRINAAAVQHREDSSLSEEPGPSPQTALRPAAPLT